MIKRTVAFSCFVVGICAPVSYGLTACSGDDDSVSPDIDSSALDTDAVANADGNTASDGGTTWLLAANNAKSNELIAVNIATGAVDGRSAFAGTFGGPTNGGAAPFLLEQDVSLVARLDPAAPWNVTSTWNVGGTDAPDGAAAYSDPDGTVVVAGNKAYVIRYTRNGIDVIDPSETVDGGAPTKTIDLSSLVQPSDSDGVVNAQAAFYDASTSRLWVVLENIDNNTYPLLCRAAKATVIAVDTTTDTLVDLKGTGIGGSYELQLADPLGVAFDSTTETIITTNYGCHSPDDAGMAGVLVGTGMEIISLATGTSSTFLTDSSYDPAGSIALVGNGQAVASLGGQGYVIDLATKAAVGAPLATIPDAFVSDGNGHLYGTLSRTVDAGQVEDVVEVTVATGAVTTLASAPFSMINGYIGSVALWTKP